MTETYPYRDPNLPVNARVTDLLSRMTLEEKVAQLHGVDPPEDETWRLFPDAMRKNLAQGVSYIGSFNRNRDTAKTVEYLNAVQKFLAIGSS